MARIKVTKEMQDAAFQLLRDRHNADDRAKLEAIAAGKRKVIDPFWWREFFVPINRAKLEAMERKADPARNDNEYERAVAARKAAEFKARQPPGLPRLRPMHLPASLPELIKQRKKTKKPFSFVSAPSHRLSDSVAPVSPVKRKSDSVAGLAALNKQRALKRLAKRANLKCQSCGKPLAAAQRATARYCNDTCRSRALRKRRRSGQQTT